MTKVVLMQNKYTLHYVKEDLASNESIYLNLLICWEISLRHVDGRGISENGKQFVSEAFQRLCSSKGIVHVRITRHRPATNGIAERFVRRLKEMLAEGNGRMWRN